jgi:hypothetical protein
MCKGYRKPLGTIPLNQVLAEQGWPILIDGDSGYRTSGLML